jgi:diguanylate cyclase (GGDEF)-like protein
MENHLYVTVSVGVAEKDDTCNNIDTLMERADRTMYLSKEKGRNQVHVWEGK